MKDQMSGKDEATKKNKVSFDVFIIRFTTMASIKNKKVNKAIPIYSKQVSNKKYIIII